MELIAQIDRTVCQGHAQCLDAASDIFDIGDDGLAYTLDKIRTEDQLGRVKDAMIRCPVDAITIR